MLFREVKLKSATIRNSYRLYPESPEIQVGMIRKDPKTSAYKITLLLLPQNDAVKPIYIGNSVLQIRQPTVAELTKILKEAKKIFATEMDCYEMYDRIDEDWKKAIADHSKLLEDLRKVKKRKNAQPFIFFSGNGYPHDLIAKLERQLSEFAENNPKSPQFKR